MNKSQHESRDKGRVLKELKAAQERGIIKGFYGRLVDLGTIHQQYDVAISTAFANNWNSWLSKPLRTLNNASIISSKMPLAEHHSLCWKK